MELVIEQPDIDAADFARDQLPGRYTWDICCICPLGQSLMRAGYTNVLVGITLGRVLTKDMVSVVRADGHEWTISGATANFMAKWDEGFPVHPVTLKLEEATV